MKLKKRLKNTVDKCLLIPAIFALSGAIYFNMLYYGRQRVKIRSRDPIY
jgi:hypothetical protein